MTPGGVLLQAAESGTAETGIGWEWGRDPELCLYRGRTISVLQRYLRLSLEVGRLPSLLGREFFRTRVTTYRMATFEDAVIFVYDVERSVAKLDEFSQQLIARIVLQEYTQDEAARLLNCNIRTVQRCLPEAIDQLTEIFLSGGLLKRLAGPTYCAADGCQGAE